MDLQWGEWARRTGVGNPGSGIMRSAVNELHIHQRRLSAGLIQGFDQILSHSNQLLMPSVMIHQDSQSSLLKAGDVSMGSHRRSNIGRPHRTPYRRVQGWRVAQVLQKGRQHLSDVLHLLCSFFKDLRRTDHQEKRGSLLLHQKLHFGNKKINRETLPLRKWSGYVKFDRMAPPSAG